MKIDVGIATIRPDTLSDAVQSIMRQTHRDWRLTIIGQGSDPQLVSVGNSLARDPRIRYFHLEKKGLSAARNKAIEVMDAEVMAFTDDDCEADENWLSELNRIFLDPAVGMVAGLITASLPSRPGFGFIAQNQNTNVDYVSGANMALRASAIRKSIRPHTCICFISEERTYQIRKTLGRDALNTHAIKRDLNYGE